MNPLYQMMQNQNVNPMVQRFLQFRNNFRGDARAQVQQMLNSGRITQAQYDQAVKTANELMRMLSPGARG